eukprot:TRINITY_DN3447_c0_g1_i2.p1 TRINITY_DN3447_c0_g1~~TRINITY_DN3447_c0_g1_i2.p1  ORF type:complete len:524 (-),score=79.35 TRINITY_DN3447_c0_g1_i2:74-1645(-)
MGGGESKPNDRVFILIGKSRAGKSTIGNLLLGNTRFKVSESEGCYSTTTAVNSGETTFSHGILGGGYIADAPIKIKVIDQPGMDDTNIGPKTHCENLVKCLGDLNVKTFPTFLLIIKLTTDRFLDDNCSLLTKLSFLLTQDSYSLFPNTIIVFTHADRVCDDITDKDKLMRIVHEKCLNVGWRGLAEILEAIDHRCIFADGTNTNTDTRYDLIRNLFEISRSILQIRFHGNNDFTSEHLKRKLGIDGDGIVEEKLNRLHYQFHPDINLFWEEEIRNFNLGEQIEKAIQSMVALGEGISSMVVLINLFTPFSSQMEELIYQLPTHYVPEGSQFDQEVKQWWNHVFIVFEVSSDIKGEATVKENLKYNGKLKILADKTNNRWTWIAEDTSQRNCRNRITEMCLRTRKEFGGKVFIQGTVIKELKEMIKHIPAKSKDTRVEKCDLTFKQKMAQGAINFTVDSENKILAKFWGMPLKSRVSVRLMRLLLRNTLLSKEEIKRFHDQYKDPNAKVSFEEVLRFLAPDAV